MTEALDFVLVLNLNVIAKHIELSKCETAIYLHREITFIVYETVISRQN